MPNANDFVAKIKVVGVGGAGTNAVNTMIDAGVSGVEFIAMNTDMKSLSVSEAEVQIVLGDKLTGGLGAGMDPDKGRLCAEESIDEIREVLQGADMVIITTGEGGGTGTGAAPVIARVAKEELDILTVAVVTTPFDYEGKPKMQIAKKGIEDLKAQIDAIAIVNNQNLLSLGDLTTQEGFRISNEVLRQNIQAITDIVSETGYMGGDLADIRTTLKNKGTMLIGIGEAEGEERALEAAQDAISSELVDVTIDGATNAIIALFGSSENLKLSEMSKASSLVEGIVAEDAMIKTPLYYDDMMGDTVRVVVIAAGFDENNSKKRVSGENQAPRTLDNPVLDVPYISEDGPEPMTSPKTTVKTSPVSITDDVNSGLDFMGENIKTSSLTSDSTSRSLFSSSSIPTVTTGSIESITGQHALSPKSTSASHIALDDDDDEFGVDTMEFLK